MHSLIRRFARDLEKVHIRRAGKLIPLSDLTLRQFFTYVRKIPYRRDTKPVEVISRPRYILQYQGLGMDCKKKAILVGAWAKVNGTPWRLIASSTRGDKRVHHVFPQVKLNGRWRNVDATYKHYRPFQHKRVTFAEVLQG